MTEKVKIVNDMIRVFIQFFLCVEKLMKKLTYKPMLLKIHLKRKLQTHYYKIRFNKLYKIKCNEAFYYPLEWNKPRRIYTEHPLLLPSALLLYTYFIRHFFSLYKYCFLLKVYI